MHEARLLSSVLARQASQLLFISLPNGRQGILAERLSLCEYDLWILFDFFLDSLFLFYFLAIYYF